jgi:dihydrodipicolinate reductase
VTRTDIGPKPFGRRSTALQGPTGVFRQRPNSTTDLHETRLGGLRGRARIEFTPEGERINNNNNNRERKIEFFDLAA